MRTSGTRRSSESGGEAPTTSGRRVAVAGRSWCALPLEEDVRVKEVKVSITSSRVSCKIGEKMILEGA